MHPYHQQWAPAPPPQPAVPVDNPFRNTADEVRTIFISGLPDDVKERELQNLLRWLPGYEASQVNFKGEQPMGFALFSTTQLSMAAKDALQGMVFDAEKHSVLHTEMAKKNLFVKRGVVADPNSFDQSKRPRTGGDYSHTAYPSPVSFHSHPPPPPVWGPPPPAYMAPPAPYDPYGGYPVPPLPLPAPPPVPFGGYAPVQNMKDNPPCNTLFIGNLGENIVEEELRGLFNVQPGFKQMKVLRQERNTVCFIEFDDVNNATTVHQSLQGAVLPSSGRGIRIQCSQPGFKQMKVLRQERNTVCFIEFDDVNNATTVHQSLQGAVLPSSGRGIRIQFSKNPFGRRKDSINGVPSENGAIIPYQQ